MDPTRRAGDVWNIKRKPVDILGRLMIRLDFQLKDWDITVHHTMCKTIEEAEAECARIRSDMEHMPDGKFRSKYKIAHDLRGAY